MVKKTRLPGSVKFSALYFGGLPILQIPIIGLLVGLWAWFKSPQYLNRIEEIQLADSEGEYAHWSPFWYKICRITRHIYLWGAILMTIVYVGYGGVMFYIITEQL